MSFCQMLLWWMSRHSPNSSEHKHCFWKWQRPQKFEAFRQNLKLDPHNGVDYWKCFVQIVLKYLKRLPFDLIKLLMYLWPIYYNTNVIKLFKCVNFSKNFPFHKNYSIFTKLLNSSKPSNKFHKIFNRTACIKHLCRKTAVLNCHRCLTNTGI